MSDPRRGDASVPAESREDRVGIPSAPPLDPFPGEGGSELPGRRVRDEAWRDLGGDPALLERITRAPDVMLPSRLDVTTLAFDSVALAILAANRLLAARGLAADVPDVTVDGARLVTSFQSERHVRIDGGAPSAWAPLSGFWETADGWVRTHGNYPHHAERLRRILRVPADATKDDLRDAFRSQRAQSLEDAAAASGAIAVRVRAPEEWAAHPQAQAIRETPLLHTERRPGGFARTWTPNPARPLDGIRVLDLTRVIAGPVATRDLAFAGATVLRVDAPQLPEIPWQHLDTGQGKRSTLLDLASRSGRAVFHDLLADADVLVTGYRPGALDALGLDPDALARRHPGLVIGSVSAWGATGPWARRRGFDSVVQAASGIAAIESDDGVTPGALPAQALDHSAGHLLAAGLMTALLEQRTDGGTRFVSIALARVAQSLLDSPRTEEKSTARIPAPALQVGPSGTTRLTTAQPVLTYGGAPPDYPELTRPWGESPASW